MVSFYLEYLFKDPVSKYGHIEQYWELGLQYEYCRDTYQPGFCLFAYFVLFLKSIFLWLE